MNAHNHNRPTLSLAALSALACTFAAGLATAATPVGEPSVAVQLRHVNFANPRDVADLYHRIAQAARSVCRVSQTPADGSAMKHASSCYEATMERAISDVNSPALTALYRVNTTRVAGR
jgi:UrcA family protein